MRGADLRFVMPTEGPSLWMDNLVIPKKAPNVEGAHKFIDFLLRPDVAKLVAEEVGYTSPNLAAIALLPEKVRNNRTAYPAPEDLAKGEFQVDVGDALPIYEKYWTAQGREAEWLQMKTPDYRAANTEAARFILADPDRYGGPGAGPVVWAALFKDRHPDGWQMLCPTCDAKLAIRDGRAECQCGYAARIEGLP